MALMAMPKTTVNENHSTVLRKHEVRTPGQIFTMEPVAESEKEEPATDEVFRLRVLAPNP
jgi:hypothetical protein